MNSDETISVEVKTDLQKSANLMLSAEETKVNSSPIFSNNGHSTSAADLVKRGRQVYEKLKDYLESRQFGRFVAIEPRSELYFLGDTGTEALVAAHTALPEAHFFLARIGHKTAHRMGGHAEVLIGEDEYSLLGTELLGGTRLMIDYVALTVSIDC